MHGQQLRSQVEPPANQPAQPGRDQEGKDLPARVGIAQWVPGGLQVGLQRDRLAGESTPMGYSLYNLRSFDLGFSRPSGVYNWIISSITFSRKPK